MRAARLISVVALLALTLGCAARPRVPPPLDLSARLGEADALVRAGCFDCLRDALDRYQALRSVTGALPAAIEQASAGAFRSAALLALRQRELGMADDGYLKTARDLLASGAPGTCGGASPPCDSLNQLLDVASLALRTSSTVARPATNDTALAELQQFNRNRGEYGTLLRETAGRDLLAGYAWLSFACGSATNVTSAAQAIEPVDPALRDLPLFAFKRATCLTTQPPALERILENDSRFLDVTYLLGLAAVGRRKLDDADTWLQRGFDWQPRWPALTLTIANVAMTAEDFDRSLDFYNKTLDLEPDAVDALIGKVRALTYLARHEEAIATADQLLGKRWYPGDAYYWRAYNELQLDRLDAAWADVEASARLLINAAVPKLTGLIALRRRELDVARVKFEESLQREARDCEVGFYLGVVVAEQKNWLRASSTFTGAIGCLESAIGDLQFEIERIRRSDDPPARQARQIAGRERRIAASRRLIATSTFNTAVAYFNLSRDVEARPYAMKVADDEQFGERAREILSRLK